MKQESTGTQLAGYNCQAAGYKDSSEVCEESKEPQPEHERGVRGASATTSVMLVFIDVTGDVN